MAKKESSPRKKVTNVEAQNTLKADEGTRPESELGTPAESRMPETSEMNANDEQLMQQTLHVSGEKPSSTLDQQDQTGEEPMARNALFGGMFGDSGGASGVQAGGLDLGSLLGGLLGGMGGMSGGTPGAMGGTGAGGPLDSMVGPLADNIAAKVGLPREIVMMGAMFLISKLLSGSLGGGASMGGQPMPPQMPPQMPSGTNDPYGSGTSNNQMPGGIDIGSILGGILGGAGGAPMPGNMSGQPQSPQMPSGANDPYGNAGQTQMPGEIDLGSILGGLLGGMGGTQMPPGMGSPDAGGGGDVNATSPAPSQGGDEVLGKIGTPIGDAGQATPTPQGGIRIQGLTANNTQQFMADNNLANEFAQYANVDEETAARSMDALLKALTGGQK